MKDWHFSRVFMLVIASGGLVPSLPVQNVGEKPDELQVGRIFV
jgi:hypothetical protein